MGCPRNRALRYKSLNRDALFGQPLLEHQRRVTRGCMLNAGYAENTSGLAGPVPFQFLPLSTAMEAVGA